MSVISGEAPWYDKAGMTKIDTTKEITYFYPGQPEFMVDNTLTFPGGSSPYLENRYPGSFFMLCEGTRIPWNGSYTEKIIYFNFPAPYEAYAYYESTSSYTRILYEPLGASSAWGRVEIVFFDDGDIQYHSSKPGAGTIKIYYDKWNDAEDTSGQEIILEYKLGANEKSVLLTRVSNSEYTVHSNSYDNRVPVPEKIIDSIALCLGEKTFSHYKYDGTTVQSTIKNFMDYIPIRKLTNPASTSTTYKLRACASNGEVGYLKTSADSTTYNYDPPLYVNKNGTTYQLRNADGDDTCDEYAIIRCEIGDWKTLSGNLSPNSRYDYWWINPQFRSTEWNYRNVDRVYIKFNFIENTALKTLRVYTLSSNLDDRVADADYKTSITSYKIGEGYSYWVEVSHSGTFGGALICPDINNTNQSYTYSLPEIWVRCRCGISQA